MALSLEHRIALCYKVPRATPFVSKDILLMKKLNSIFQKMEKTNNKVYILETFNTLKTLSNVFDIAKVYLILCEFIDIEYHDTLAFLIEQTIILNENEMISIIRKLQHLAEDK